MPPHRNPTSGVLLPGILGVLFVVLVVTTFKSQPAMYTEHVETPTRVVIIDPALTSRIKIKKMLDEFVRDLKCQSNSNTYDCIRAVRIISINDKLIWA